MEDNGRRTFLAAVALAAGNLAIKSQEKKAAAADSLVAKKVDGGLAEILGKREPERTVPLVPFGSSGVKEFYSRCSACQLCVSQCPNRVLRPSASMGHLMQPEMSYRKGWCRVECTRCSQVCPTGAIRRITPEEKSVMHIGTAKVEQDLCVVNRDGVSCGNCARHCPAGAIMMLKKEPDNPDSPRIPVVNESRCIGCGACEYLCPSRPYSAIHVNGLIVHREE